MSLESLKAELRDARYAMLNSQTRAQAAKHSNWYQQVKDRIVEEEQKLKSSSQSR